jgi:DNA-binding NarL/FixJ family response regulator
VDAFDDATLQLVTAAAETIFRCTSRVDTSAVVSLGGLGDDAHLTLTSAGTSGPVMIVLNGNGDAPDAGDPFASLTAKERDVARLVSSGLTNREIADRLYISVATVKDHVHHILVKSGLANRAAVAGRWHAR